jgi:hypothetical protein
MNIRLLALTTLIGVLAASAQGGAPEAHDQILPPIGGPGGGQFFSRCGWGEILSGVDVDVGDDVDGIHILCRQSHAPTGGAAYGSNEHFGGYGSEQVGLFCPDETPAVAGLEVAYEGEQTIIVNSVHLFCSLGLPNQPLTTYPSKVFDGPAIGGQVPLRSGRAICPAGLIAVGITGRSGKWLDALSLICGTPPYVPAPPRPPRVPVKSLGRVNTGLPVQRNPNVHSICDSARDALGRQSPASPNLVAQCRAQGGNATAGPSNVDLERVRARGEALAAADLSMGLLRARTPDPDRRGFEVGLGIWEGNTAPGPGKQRYHDALTGVEQRGFDVAAAYTLPRNKHDALVKVGLAIAAADPEVRAARAADSDPFYWLGFDIASGIFGDPAAGSQGSKALDAAAVVIRTPLDATAQRGFNASMQLHTGRTYQ